MPREHSRPQIGLLESVGAGTLSLHSDAGDQDGAVQAVSDVDTLLHILCSMCQRVREEEIKQDWGQDATLVHSSP